MDENIREALQDLERVLLEAVTSSSEAARALRRLRDNGFSIYLAVDCGDSKNAEAGDADPARPLQLAMRRGSDSTEPTYRIDRSDFNFLRSIGIDPTPGGTPPSTHS